MILFKGLSSFKFYHFKWQQESGQIIPERANVQEMTPQFRTCKHLQQKSMIKDLPNYTIHKNALWLSAKDL